MNLLLIGSGGREHALAWKIAQSPLLTRLVAAPGSPGRPRAAQRLGQLQLSCHWPQ
jgi:phosphoribosylamine--glycine ligase